MTTWKQLKVAPICERLIGFSIPVNNRVLIISYEATHILYLDNDISIEHDYRFREYDIYDPDLGLARYQGIDYTILGLYEGKPITNSSFQETIELDINSETLTIKKQKQVIYSTKYKNFSGDWAIATFSPDGKYIVLGCPYDFDFRVWQRS